MWGGQGCQLLLYKNKMRVWISTFVKLKRKTFPDFLKQLDRFFWQGRPGGFSNFSRKAVHRIPSLSTSSHNALWAHEKCWQQSATAPCTNGFCDRFPLSGDLNQSGWFGDARGRLDLQKLPGETIVSLFFELEHSICPLGPRVLFVELLRGC